MASADDQLQYPHSPILPVIDIDPEISAITDGLRAVTVDGEPDYAVRAKTYIEFKERTYALWKEIDEREAARPKGSSETSGVAPSPAVEFISPLGTEYRGLGPPPKLAWKLPGHPEQYYLSDIDSRHYVELPSSRNKERDAADIARADASMAEWEELERAWTEAFKDSIMSEEEKIADAQDMTWFLREAERARDDPERDSSFETWDRLLPSGSWKAVYDTWSAEQDEKERQAAQTEADAASKTKGKGKAKK